MNLTNNTQNPPDVGIINYIRGIHDSAKCDLSIPFDGRFWGFSPIFRMGTIHIHCLFKRFS